MNVAKGKAKRRKKHVMLQRELESRVARLEAQLAKEEEERCLAEEAREQERERVAALLEKERLKADAKVREQTRLAQDSLAKLREIEGIRASESRMLEQFRRKERQAREKVGAREP